VSADLLGLVRGLSDEQLADLVDGLSPAQAAALLAEVGGLGPSVPTPSALGARLFDPYIERAHLTYLSDQVAAAVADVEAGQNRSLIIQMPPRSGKTTATTLLTPSWIMAEHPDWPVALTSHDGGLATSWGRQIRRWAEEGALGPGVRVARDAGAVSAWETVRGGKLLSLSLRESFTGRGAKVLIIDDPHKDFVDAHSSKMRDNVWEWWLSVAQPRLEPPYLVIVVMTRWHEDDFVGRLLSPDHEGDPDDWQVIRLPAIAEDGDLLGREPGEPLFSPLVEETPEQALERWATVRRSVGEYIWSAMYQQRPSPAKGAIFDSSAWRYWTTDPSRVTDDGRVVYLDPSTLNGARWLDSWDFTFEGTETSDYVVGQRWARQGPNRYLIAQHRARMSFTQTLAVMRRWASSTPYSSQVHQRLVEAKANGAAVIDTLRDELSGIKPIRPTASKEARARIITPEVESGHVYLPHPQDPGNEWVLDLLSELRNFPNDAHDDQVDALTQALAELRDVSAGGLSVPGRQGRPVGQRALTTRRTIPRRG
jgi:predicted phage terminase large subunit-like protein